MHRVCLFSDQQSNKERIKSLPVILCWQCGVQTHKDLMGYKQTLTVGTNKVWDHTGQSAGNRSREVGMESVGCCHVSITLSPSRWDPEVRVCLGEKLQWKGWKTFLSMHFSFGHDINTKLIDDLIWIVRKWVKNSTKFNFIFSNVNICHFVICCDTKLKYMEDWWYPEDKMSHGSNFHFILYLEKAGPSRKLV